jgi:hypothetical protein
MNPQVSVEAADLAPGMFVLDNFTAWAKVLTAEWVCEPQSGLAVVEVQWALASGRREVETYTWDDEFTLVGCTGRDA